MSVHYELRGRIAIVTIDRPEVRNAVDVPTANALAEAFRRFDDDDEADVAVLTGEGGSFCAGADLKAVAAGELRDFSPEADGPMGPTRMQLRKPVIAAIEGHAVAGGLELAVWCDLRVMAEDAVMGVFCRRFGVPLIDLGTIRLPRLIGHSRAMDLILTGRPISAQEAADMGLANRVARPGEARETAVQLGEQIARHPSLCMQNDRRSAIEQWSLTEEEAMRNELALGLDTIQSGETVSGAQSFQVGAGRHG
ncbi:MAG: crotonase/enoyl-CoA hydratase family protein, partial [Myxococcales bacterium]|nr:crotonase/enoyl-CoA hydratase family protein [Myxococcales bacterium]